MCVLKQAESRSPLVRHWPKIAGGGGGAQVSISTKATMKLYT